MQARDKELAKWGFPGGALEYGESYANAAIRECREETGYEIALDEFIGIFDEYFASYPNGNAQTIVVAYTGHIVSGEEFIDNKETYALKWFAADEMPALFNEQNQIIYKSIKANGGASLAR